RGWGAVLRIPAQTARPGFYGRRNDKHLILRPIVGGRPEADSATFPDSFHRDNGPLDLNQIHAAAVIASWPRLGPGGVRAF
ncbi:MAG: hypothetical protein ACXWCP_32110, partial [Burkholderiales bacterium]